MALTMSWLHSQIQEKAIERGLTICNCLSSGNIFANIAIVSTAPGPAEIRTGIPFSGGAGNLLWDACRKKGITRNDVYVTNVIKDAINAREEMERKAVSSATFGLWCELLKWELSQLPNLKYILVLGNEALQALTGKTGILHERGSWLTGKVWSRDVDMLVTINPVMVTRCNRILRGEEDSSSAPPLRAAHKIFEFDINKFRLLIDGKLTRYEITSRINPTFNEALEYINDCAHSPSPVATDIETIIGHSKNHKDETACVGFALTPGEGMCIPFIDSELQSYWPLDQELKIRRAIAVAYQTQKKLVAQNGIFDAIWLWFNDKIVLPIWYDTLLAHHTLYPNLPHSLEFLCSRYTTHPYYKSDKDGWKSVGGVDRFWKYNVTDCCITLAVQQATQQELVKAGLDEFFFNHVMRLHPHLSRMTVGGIKVDDVYKQHVRSELEVRLERLLADFHAAVHAATGDNDYFPNPKSPRDKGELFFNKLKLVGRGTATDKANIKRMLSHSKTSNEAKDVLNKLSVYTKAFKFYSVYANSKIDSDGRARCEYKQFGTTKAPGRLSSAQAPWGSGLNLQTVPSQAYPMFICEPGYCLIYFDLEQAEARVVGWLAGIQKWIDDFEKARIEGNFDCHRSLAADMWNMPYDEVPKEDKDDEDNFTLRYLAKRCLPPSVDVLTKRGWISIAEACKTKEAIAIWQQDKTMSWEVPSDWYEADEDGHVIDFIGEFVCLTTTLDHRMPVFNNGKWTERSAESFLSKRYGGMPTNGIMKGGIYYPYARLWAMCWADGTIEANYHNSIRVSVAKERKAIRLRQLVKDARFELWEGYSGGIWHFRIYGFRKKHLDWSVLEWDAATREAFIDELKYWDGCPKTGRIFNCDLEGMRIIQAVAHITGYRATIFDHGVAWRGRERQCYMMRPVKVAQTYYASMEVRERRYTGKIYCPTVSTGAFLVRDEDTVCVTLNCRHGLNYRMQIMKLAETTGLSLREAADAYNRYHRINPELRRWWQATEQQATKTKTLFNLYGRRWVLTELITEQTLESIVAFVPQSTIGDKVNRVIYMAEEDDDWPSDARIALNIHDALIGIAPIEKADTCLRILRKHAEEPLYIPNQPPLIIPAALKKTKKATTWRVVTDDTGKERVEFYDDETMGFHRWSELAKVALD